MTHNANKSETKQGEDPLVGIIEGIRDVLDAGESVTSMADEDATHHSSEKGASR